MSAAVIMYDGKGMSRWDPNGRGRLEQAAYELFLERGYDQTTVADIAARAGLTERTFFRHFADKREVLFGGSSTIHDLVLSAIGELPQNVATIDVVRVAIEAIANLMHGRRALSRERQQIIKAHADLQERELIKRATLTAALATALQNRGVPESAARLAADMGMGVFYVGFIRWLDDPANREFIEIVREGFEELKVLAAG